MMINDITKFIVRVRGIQYSKYNANVYYLLKCTLRFDVRTFPLYIYNVLV